MLFPIVLAVLIGLAGAVLLLFLLFGVRMRRRRHRASAAQPVYGNVMRVRNSFTDLYGARVGEQVVLFDAGFDPQGRALDVLLRALSATRDDVGDVFLSHGHFDHVAAAPLCRRARIHVGAGDVEMLAHRAPIIPLGVSLFDRMLPVPAVEATNPLCGRTTLPLPGGHSVVAIPYPGHTPGSYLMLFDGVLFTGDSLRIRDGKLDVAIPPFSVDMAENRRSAARLAALIAGERVEVVCTGHEGCTRPGEAMALIEDLACRAGGWPSSGRELRRDRSATGAQP